MAHFTFGGHCWPPFAQEFRRTGHWPLTFGGNATHLQLSTFAYGTGVSLLVTLPEAPEDLAGVDLGTLRNRVREFAQWTLNVHAFATGEFRTLEVTTCETDEQTRMFAASAFLASMRQCRPAAQRASTQNVDMTPKSLQFFVALKSLQLAILEPEETPFLAYRAIESIRHAYYLPGENRRQAAGASWARMWFDLGLSAVRTRAIQEHAEEIRHGGAADVTWEVRNQAVEAAFEVLDAFALKHIWLAQSPS